MVSFVIEGPPVGKERPRVVQNRKTGRVMTYTPKATRQYEARLGAKALAALLPEGEPRTWATGGRYALSVLPYYENKRRRDLDNVVKCVMDGLNEVLWDDDTQVDELYARRGYDTARPRVEVRVWLLG